MYHAFNPLSEAPFRKVITF